ncbi:MAG: DUF5312 domain-containing protein, partial [Treponemataceae bacterium]|nr:DUF5312 domain-containing protein [Treponemataceae bacterium]
MEDEQKKNSFDELVAGISADERKFLLAKLNGAAARDIPILQPVRDEAEGRGIDARYQNESVLYKLILWIRSLFEKKPPIELYNEDLIHGIARRVQHSHPGLIDEKGRLFLSVFYGRLKELKDSAEFFRPYFSVVNENPGKFYVFLSTFIAPEISAQLNAEADPYSIPFDRKPTMELRTSLMRKLEAALKEIQPATRNRLYSAAHSADWLKRFSELPFLHFSAQFTSLGSEKYTCPFSNAQVDFPIFASVLNSADSIRTEVLEALFLYPQKRGSGSVGMDAELESAMREFLERAASCISMIQMFISTVPLTAIGRVLF